MNHIKFNISIDYQDVQEEEVKAICKWVKHMLQFGKYDKKLTDYTISAIDNQEV